MNLLPVILFTNEKITACANEVAKDVDSGPRNPPSCFLFFTVSVTALSNTSESYSNFLILTKSFISLFEINRVTPLPNLTVAFSTYSSLKFIYCI